MNTYEISIKGIVQGVGFRPFIYNLADTLQIRGEIYNHSSGVTITINATQNILKQFLQKIDKQKPPLSQIDSIEYKKIQNKIYESFSIVKSEISLDSFTIMPPDISICKDCEAELKDSKNKRYKYPFITCTNCGPRYTIINKLPYDRVNTSMDKFPMCEECKKEYENPKDRRYHAQPIGCFKCGPSLELYDNKKNRLDTKDIIKSVVELLESGKILAIKGVGGYHLICDASNDEVVKKLRERKRRQDKPFAVMLKDINSAKRQAKINKKEQEILSSKERPITLLEKSTTYSLSSFIAPKINKIGLFLPYTPIHLLILEEFNKSIIATSANISDEPLATNFDEIMQMNDIWDYCLEHNREIINACDDSVVAVIKGEPIFFRRARGYAPKAITLPFHLSQKTLALGANQKSTIALGFENKVILSPHIGDLGTIKSIEYFKDNIKNLRSVYSFKEDLVVCDKHPNYESTKYARELRVKNEKLRVEEIQHHKGHIQAVRLEYGITDKVLGVAFDGTGFGDDGNLWGGEFIVCDDNTYERVAHFEYFKLLGGEKAVREPRRNALSLLFEAYGKEALELENKTIKSFSKIELNALYLSWQKGLNAPLSSSIGRIFDAVASLSGVIQTLSYEGQSGAMMERFYDENIKATYSWNLNGNIIDIKPMIKEILKDEDTSLIVSKFFNTLVQIIKEISKKYNLKLVLAGGVFQNLVLLNQIFDKIDAKIFISRLVPPNDGAIALGQIIKGK